MLLNQSKARVAVASTLLLPLLAYWIINPDDVQETPTQSALSQGADYYLKGSKVKEFDEQGKLKATLSAAELTHFPDQALSRLLSPSVEMQDEKGTPVTLTSKTGTLFDNEDRMTLDEDVRVTHNPNMPDASLLTTSSLNFDRRSGIASTDLPVKITNQQFETTATGMTININSRTSDLLSDVKGTFYVEP
ncbi:LPS export ABC transporter periplasmic protein LptC [Neptunomonas phycophila]|uniref:LPS export ABC transporter periplasmic protein LptC n=1 Tax=Neptunomonas phycophila TaxID=1572645 RepID=A0AAW7XI09_9GAMM|nr:LPS export ABC transporter periplasmic protein LptC [Neptunomonas phycophila]MDO6452709.1 LPS export ABC transporter periplasmic protein LptC [Neptunomonas phycophila]